MDAGRRIAGGADAEVADAARDSEDFGVKATLEGIDMPKVNSYRDGVVGRLYKGLQGLVKSFAFWPQVTMGLAPLAPAVRTRVAESAVAMFLGFYAV